MRKWLLVLLATVFMGSFFIQSAMAGTLCANKFGQVKYFQGSCPTGILGWIEISVTGPKGDKGDPGEPGTDGVDGTNGVSGFRIYTYNTPVNTAPFKQLWMPCERLDEKAINGGYTWENGQSHSNFEAVWTYPGFVGGQTVANGWCLDALIYAPDPDNRPNWALYGYVMCIRVQ